MQGREEVVCCCKVNLGGKQARSVLYMSVCVLTGWPGGGAVVFLLSSRDVACQRFGRPGQGRPLLRAAVCSLLNEQTH